ncbi:hypothetical protein RB595_006068 [Gaeumannomyces hyphopodioides]
MPRIVVIGAGVSGLTSALLLSENKNNGVTVVAKHMPGDYDIEYTSPWAGANVLPMSQEADSRWERRTWPVLRRLAAEIPEAGIHFQKTHILHQPTTAGADKSGGLDPLFDRDPWYKDLMPDFRPLTASELRPGTASGNEFTSVCINTALYLPWLVGQCRARGVVFRRAVLAHVHEAASFAGDSPADLVINATGVLACRLGGVMDAKVYPARGQVVVVRNRLPVMIGAQCGGGGGAADRPDELIYGMERAAGGGTVLGGSYQKGNWDPNPDPNLALRIMTRIVELCPEIAGGKGVAGLDVIRHGVGLRPYREGGVRIETEVVDGMDCPVIHNYGHAGWGYQGSYGCAERVVELADEVFARGASPKAKL